MSKATLAELRPEIKGVAAQAGLEVTDPRLDARINSAIRVMMQSEDFPMLTDRIRFDITDGNVVLPFNKERIMQAELDGCPVDYRSGWFEFIDTQPYAVPTNFTPIKDKFNLLLERGSTPLRVDIPDASDSPDYNIVIKGFADEVTGVSPVPVINIRGYDENGEWIRTSDGSGGFIDGENLTMVAGAPYETVSVSIFSSIESIVKPVTKQHVQVLARDGVDPDIELSDMRYQETVPDYHRYFIPSADFDDPQTQSLLIRSKARFVPLINDNDISPISNIEALKSMVIAQHKLDVQKADDYLNFRKIASQLLQDEAKSLVGKQKTPAVTFNNSQTMGGFGGASGNYQRW